MKLYLDLCCLNRPFDDLSQPKVNLEAQAVVLILEACQHGRHELFNSTALEVENQDATMLVGLQYKVIATGEQQALRFEHKV